MSTDLTSTKIKNTFNQLLHVDGGVTSTPKTVYDGDGTATSVKISTSGLQVNNSEVLTDADIGNSIQPYDPDLIQEIQDNADSAAASAVAAANSATNSGISAEQASGYKDQSATSALQAGNSATQAAASAASAAQIVYGNLITHPNIITESLTIPDGYNAFFIDPVEFGPNVTITGLGNSTLRGV